MSIRRSDRGSSSQSSAKLALLRQKALKLREKVKSSLFAAQERRVARLAWWQRAFRTPLVGFYGWVRSSCSSLWAVAMTLLGLKASKPSLAGRHGQIKKSSKKAAMRGLIHESLEQRQLLAVDITSVTPGAYVDNPGVAADTVVTNTTTPLTTAKGTPGFFIIEDSDNSGTFSAGDGFGKMDGAGLISFNPIPVPTVGGTSIGYAEVAVVPVFGTPITIDDVVVYTLDSTPPPTPGVPDLNALSDTGTSTTDDLTFDDTPSLTVSLPGFTVADVNTTIELLDGATSVASVKLGPADIANGFVSLTTSKLSPDGVKNISARATDPASNTASSAALPVTLDTATSAPVISLSDSALKIGDTSTLTISFTEAVAAFDNSDVTVQNGTISALATGDGGKTWTATLTPTAGVEDATNVVSVGTAYTDKAGNTGTAGSSANYTVDTKAPTVVSVTLTDSALKIGDTTLVTIVFSEAVGSFGTTIPNLNGPAFVSGDGGITWTSTLAPDASVEDATNVVTVIFLQDIAGNIGTPGFTSANYEVDTKAPTVSSIILNDSALKIGDVANLTITFSEAVAAFDNSDVTIENGTIDTLATSDGGKTWTAKLTPNAPIEDATNMVSVGTAYTDKAGNTGSGASSANYTVDTKAPTVVSVTLSDSALKIGDTTLVTIVFSEAVGSFGTTSPNLNGPAYTSGDGGITWTTTLTPDAGVEDATNVVTVTFLQDLAGNIGTPGFTSLNYTVDTKAPTVSSIILDDSALKIGDVANLTITFSEAVAAFDNSDVTIENGTIDTLATSDGGKTWKAKLTPNAPVEDPTNMVSVSAAYTDIAGNAGSGGTSANYTVDTKAPAVVSIVLDDTALKIGDVANLTITFSEAVTSFDNTDVTVENGTIDTLATSDGGITWKAKLTPAAPVEDATNMVTVGTAYTDLAANTGTGGSSANYTVDTKAPVVASITLSDSALKIGDTATLTITFSEAVTSFDNSDVTIENGTINTLTSADSGKTWTATLTPAASVEDATNKVAVGALYADLAGNGGSSASSGNYTVDTKAPTVTVERVGIDVPSSTFPVNFTATFSEPVMGFTSSDVDLSMSTATWIGSPTVVVTGGPTVYNIAVSLVLSSFGDVIAKLNAGAANDLADATGNPSAASTSMDNSIPIIGSTVTLAANDTNPNENAPVNSQYTVTISDPSTNPVIVVFDIDPASTADLGGLPLGDFLFGPQVTALGGGQFSVTIPGGGATSSTVFDIDLQDDSLYDPNETIILRLVSATNAPPADAMIVSNGPVALRTMTIVDDEAPAGLTVSVSPTIATAKEGNPTATVNGKFTLNLSQKLDNDTTVTLNVGGSAEEGASKDYEFKIGASVVSSKSGVLSVPVAKNTSSVEIEVVPFADGGLVEQTETVTLKAASITPSPGGTVTISPTTQTVNIEDDDTADVRLSSTDGSEGADKGVFTVTQSLPSSTNTVVNFTKSEGADLVFGVDYWLTYPVRDSDLTLTSTSNTGAFATNNTIATAQNIDSENWNLANVPGFGTNRASVEINGVGSVGDTYDYYKFTVGASQVVQASVTTASRRIALFGPTGISLFNSTTGFTSGSLAAGVYTLGVARSGATAPDNGFTGGSLVLGDSYQVFLAVGGHATPMPSSVTIPAGSTTVMLTVSHVDDNLLENDETVTLTLASLGNRDPEISLGPTSPSNTLVKSSTIHDNDFATIDIIGTGVTFGLNSANATNPIEPSTNGKFTVKITKPSDTAIVVPFEIASLSKATYNSDYVFGAGVSGTGTKLDPFRVTIPASTDASPITSVPINITVLNEDIVEDDEAIFLFLLDLPVIPVTDPNRSIQGPDDVPTDKGQVTIGSAPEGDSILIKDEDRAALTVNSSKDQAFEGGSNGEFTIQLSKDSTLPQGTADLPLVPVTSSQDTVVTYELTGTGANGLDISTPLTGTVTIAKGTSSTTLNIIALADGFNEPVENVVMTIKTISTGDSNVAIDPTRSSDTVFIVDANNTTVKVTTSDGSASETGPDNGQFLFELVGGDLAPAADVIVTYQLTGSATNGADYTTGVFTGTVTIPYSTNFPQKTAVIPIDVIDDGTVEGPETVNIKILSVTTSIPTGNVAPDAVDSASLTIVDNDTAKASISSASDPNAGEGSDNGEYIISLTAPTSTGVLVFYSLSTFVDVNHQAANLTGADFTLMDEYGNVLALPSGSVFIPPNTSSIKIALKVVDDAVSETLNEPVTMSLTGYGSPLVGDGSPLAATVTIQPDQIVTVSPGVNAVEGTSVGFFTVSLNRTSTVATNVTYTLTGDAVEGTDYANTTKVVTIPANTLSMTVPIDPTVTGNDLIPEPSEKVIITLGTVTNVAPNASADIKVTSVTGDKTATINILDDDKAYITIAATDRTEGDANGLQMFTLTLRDANGNPINATQDISVDYSITGGSAISPTDFALSPIPTATITKGSSSKVITVNVVNDAFVEGTEDVTVTMSKVTTAFPANTIFLSAIGGPNLVFQEGSAAPGLPAYSGTQDTYIDPDLPFSNLDTAGVFSNFDSVGPGINPQHGLLRFENIFGSGLGKIPSGTSVITSASLDLWSPAGFQGGDIDLHEMLIAWSESITWASSGGGDGVLGIQANGVDAAIAAAASGTLVDSMAGGVANISVLSSLQAWLASPASNLGWAVLPGATTPNSTNFRDSEFVTFGQRPRLNVSLSTSATAKIFDNDGGQIAITKITAAKEEVTNGVIVVSLPHAVPAGNSVTVNYTIGGGGSATAGSDYTAITGSVVITGPNSTSTFSIPVLGDDLIEGTETVQVQLDSFSVSGPNSAAITAALTIDTASKLVDIEDNDTATASVSILVSGSEIGSPSNTPESNHVDSKFLISIDKTSTQDTVLSFTITPNGNFIAGQDYEAPTAPLEVTIPAGSQTTFFPLNIFDDLLNEATESVTFTLTGTVSGPGVTPDPLNFSVTDFIEDDDSLTADITATDNSAKENPNTDKGVFTISLNKASDKATTIPFTIDGLGTADDPTLPASFPMLGVPGPTGISGPDYSLVGGAVVTFTSYTTGTISFPASATPQSTTLTVMAIQDYLAEPGADESVIIKLGDPTGGNGPIAGGPTPGPADSATVNIVDEDFSVKIEKTASFGLEDGAGNGGLNGQFTVTIANPTQAGDDVTVPFTIPNTGAFGTATYGADYTLTGAGVFVDKIGAVIEGHVVITGGTTTRLITVSVLPDSLVEGPETADITIGTPSDTLIGGTLSKLATPASLTKAQEMIIDDDAPIVSIAVIDDLVGSDPAGIGEQGPNVGVFRFSLDQKIPGESVTITYQVIPTVPAANDVEAGDYNSGDYTGTIVVNAGDLFVDLPITPVDDNSVEGDEKLTVKILTATSKSFPITKGVTTATATISDNDTATISIKAIDADAREPSNPGIFELTMSKPSETDTIVTYTVGGDALPGAVPGLLSPSQPYDYKTLTGTATIKAGNTTVQILVDTFEDPIVEDDEKVIVTLDIPTNNLLINTLGGNDTVVIGADVPANQDVTTATITKTSDATEGGPAGVFTVTLSKAADEDITFPIIVTHGSSSAADISIPSTVTVLKGTTSTTFNVNATTDSVVEGTETFNAQLGTPSAAFVNPTAPVLVLTAGNPSMDIIDSNSNVLTISSPSVTEGDSGTKVLTFTVTSPVATKSSFNLPYNLTGGTANNTGSAAGKNDFVAATASGSLSFTGAAGQTRTFSVTVNGDKIVEANETIEITLGTPSAFAAQMVTGAVGTGTITNDDTAVFDIANSDIFETNSGVPTMPFTITILNGYTFDIPVDVVVSFTDGTAKGLPYPSSGPLAYGMDYDTTSQTINFPAGSASQGFDVKIIGDSRVEGTQAGTGPIPNGSENFNLALATSTIRSNNHADTAVGTIKDDDTAIVTVTSLAGKGGDDTASEPGAGQGTGKFIFELSNDVEADVIVTYSFTLDGAAGDPNGDLATPLTGTIKINGSVTASNTSNALIIEVHDDQLLEDNEAVVVTITGVSGDPSVSKSNTPATVTILDDDTATVSIRAIDDEAQEPGVAPNKGSATYEVFLSKLSDTPTTVKLVIIPTAVNGADPIDYTGLPVSVTIPAHQSSTTFSINPVQDFMVEPTEYLNIGLENLPGSITGNPNITRTTDPNFQSDIISILDSGSGYFVSFATSKTVQGNEQGPVNGQFVVQLTDNLGNPISLPNDVTVVYSVDLSSTALAPSDYAGLTNSVVINSGFSTAPIAVIVVDDLMIEPTEFVKLNITSGTSSGPETIQLGSSASIPQPIMEKVNILDNDAVPANVQAIKINGGAAQRSNAKSITIEFDSLVTILPGAFTVEKRSDVSLASPVEGPVGGLIVTPSVVSGKTVATLTFTPSATFVDAVGSLVDGNFQVKIDPSKVTTGIATPLAGSAGDPLGGNFIYGDQATDDFYRLFGDKDGALPTGDAFVDLLDYNAIRTDLLTSTYEEFFDRAGDGFVDILDVAEVRSRLLAGLQRDLDGFNP